MSRARSGGASIVLVWALLAGAVACSDQPADLGAPRPTVPATASPASPTTSPTQISPDRTSPTQISPPQISPTPGSPSVDPPDVAAPGTAPESSGAPALLPNGTRKVFAGGDFLVAYYGTAGTGSLGVLGEGTPEVADRRLRAAARPFRRPGHPVQRVYELIVTVADRVPGPDGDFSHDIPRERVQHYVDLAHRDGALLLLDLQPGRSGFLDVAQRWEWALRDPWVGLALDPEWRMGRRQVPGRTVGRVEAREVDRTSAWLARLVRDDRLPEKLFVLHQFRAAMIRGIDTVRPRRHLAEVQHVDGFGTPRQKRATYAAVARPGRFTMGFKLFYDEDIRRMGPTEVFDIRPRVRFVSFQ